MDEIEDQNLNAVEEVPQELESQEVENPESEIQQEEPQRDILSEIEDAELSAYILRKLQEDINHREFGGWTTQQKYAEASYAGYRKVTTDPWKNSSNYSVRMTKTLIDTAHANSLNSIFDNKEKVVDAHGIGKEDVKNEQHVESVLNFEVLCDIEDSFNTIDATILRGFKNGNGIIKCFPGWEDEKGKIIWKSVPIQYVFLPINCKSAQPKDADHIFEIIPLTDTEYESRKLTKDPSGEIAYKDFDDLQKGNSIQFGAALNDVMAVRDAITKSSLGDFYTDSVRYIMECYLTYPHKDKKTGDVTLVELIVTLSPNGGKIHRKKINQDIDETDGQEVRPYSIRWIPYPNEDRIYGTPLSWIVKKDQEELDYFHNAMANALEKVMKPPTFYDPNGSFDPEEVQQAPNGWYPVPNPRQNIFIPQYDYASIFQLFRMIDMFWENAERSTGLTELFQGMQSQSGSTLGEVERRMNKAEIRFDTVYKRLEQGFQELIYLTWHYVKKYMPKEQVIRILGTGEFKKIEEVFPQGIEGSYNFKLTSSPITERLREKQDAMDLYTIGMASPIVVKNEADQWRLLDMVFKSKGVKDLGHYVQKPKSVEIIPADEAVRRIMGGELNYIPHPAIDADSYIIEIQMFMRTDTFNNATPEEKQAIQKLLQIANFYRQGQIQANLDAKIIQQNMQAESQMNNMPVPMEQGQGDEPE